MIQQRDVFAIDLQDPLFLKLGKQAADGLNSQPEHIGNIATRHTQIKLTRRVTTLLKTM